MKIEIGTLLDGSGKLAIDVDQFTVERGLIQAQSGGGKSHELRCWLEQAHGKVQLIVLDWEGEFFTLREKFDFLVVGKGKDLTVDAKSAELLARRLLELSADCIIDLSDFKKHERIKFVKLFSESLIAAPKDLWHPVWIVYDEGQHYVPEKGGSIAMEAVVEVFTQGRKRDFCPIIATQRLSAVSKDVAAECVNKLIGRTGLDIDRKRASEELGFVSKEQNLSLRKLKPGEFYAFGSAISDDVILFRGGEVHTTHGRKVRKAKLRPPSPKVKKWIAAPRVPTRPGASPNIAPGPTSRRRERYRWFAYQILSSATGTDYIVRRVWTNRPGCWMPSAGIVSTGVSLKVARKMIPRRLERVERQPSDHRNVLEIWQ